MSWRLEDMPSQAGKTWVVTGANSGVGLATTKALAVKGARVVMACRDLGRSEAAAAEVRALAPAATVELRRLDVASLASIEAFASELGAALPALDGLINNAGVMALPRALTADGFELQLGTNHLGPFALTMRLLPLLEQAPAARVVAVSSQTHRLGALAFDDLMGERRYQPWLAYAQSKLANLLFTFELQRRLAGAEKRTIAVAGHPGYAATNLVGVAPRLTGSAFGKVVMALGNALLAQSAEMGALPVLYAATAAEVQGGDYFGPEGLFELFGYPVPVGAARRARDEAAARRLWERSETLTKTRFPW